MLLRNQTGSSIPIQTREREPAVDPANRKLIRPSLTEMKERGPARKDGQKKSLPPDRTNAENFYYLKQMQSKTPMTIMLKDRETLKGVIEWYDKTGLKVNREGDQPAGVQVEHQVHV